MRISLWQQFSSNHSGFYWVIGTFETPDAAQHAYDEIRQMLQQLDAWHREHPHAIEDAFLHGKGKPLPPEQEIAEKYGLEWPHTIDWANWANYYMEGHPMLPNLDAAQGAATCINLAVRVTQNLVFAENPDQTWMTMHPFKSWLEHFGAATIGFDFDHTEGWDKTFIQINATPPDAETAEKLRQLPPGLTFTEWSVAFEGNTLIYTSQIASFEDIAGLVAVLKSNHCNDIRISHTKRD